MNRLPKCLREELEGVDYVIVMGSRHLKIFVKGRLAAIWPRGVVSERSPRGTLNIRAQIRRAKRAS